MRVSLSYLRLLVRRARLRRRAELPVPLMAVPLVDPEAGRLHRSRQLVEIAG